MVSKPCAVCFDSYLLSPIDVGTGDEAAGPFCFLAADRTCQS